ncbi:MAG: NADH-ubiquinone oxidoreductase [Puniceicoccaceae bacterium]|nr:MAG: NADH-ubiquinone oxidoreductase [Puniceicoccaceae bacterium]
MILLCIIHLPILLACLLPCLKKRTAALGWLGVLAALPAGVLAWSGVVWPEVVFADLFLGSVLVLDPLRLVFLALTGTLWTLAGWYARSYLADDARAGRFQCFFLLSMAGNFGLILAADLITFYGFFVLMTFASYGLVVHQADPEAHRAGRIYLIMSLLGEVLLLSAMFLAVDAAGGQLRLDALSSAIGESPNRGLICTLAFLGFGVKAGAVPLYFWLPLAHPVAPTPASAVLSGAMIKAGLLGWIHFLPLGEQALPTGSGTLIFLGFLAAFGAAGLGLCQQNAKTILAYSSISQMGLMTVLLGISLAHPALWPVAAPALALFALHHGLAKGALFLGTGLLPVCPARWRRWVWAGLALAALAIAGAPLTSGALAKYGLKEVIAGTHHPDAGWLLLLLTLSAITTSLLLAKFLRMLGRGKQPAAHGTFAGLGVPWAVLILFVALGPYFAVMHFGLPLPFPPLTWGNLVGGLWPVLAGGMIFVGFLRLAPQAWRAIRIPAGDGIVLIERLITTLYRKIPFNWGDWWDREFLNFTTLSDRIMDIESTRSVVNRIEPRLGIWAVVGFILIGLILCFISLLIL